MQLKYFYLNEKIVSNNMLFAATSSLRRLIVGVFLKSTFLSQLRNQNVDRVVALEHLEQR